MAYQPNDRAQIVKGQMWVHFAGRTFVYDGDSKRFGKRSSSEAVKHGNIVAPMPGKVTKVIKSVGQAVNAGDVVLVMEAMKMEYSLKAEIAGTVTSLDCKVGDQVSLGKLLMKIGDNK